MLGAELYTSPRTRRGTSVLEEEAETRRGPTGCRDSNPEPWENASLPSAPGRLPALSRLEPLHRQLPQPRQSPSSSLSSSFKQQFLLRKACPVILTLGVGRAGGGGTPPTSYTLAMTLSAYYGLFVHSAHQCLLSDYYKSSPEIQQGTQEYPPTALKLSHSGRGGGGGGPREH